MLPLVISPPEDEPPTEPDPLAPNVNVWRGADGLPVAFSSATGDRRQLHWPGVARFEFTLSGDVVTAVPCQPARLDLIHEVFRHSVLPLALQALGCQAIHASAVLTQEGVVGFCGHAQVGKSTLAYAISERGYLPWSDDAVVFEVEKQTPRVLQLPFEFRLRPASAAFFGQPRRLQPGCHSAVSQRAPLAALCVLTRAAAGTSAPEFTIAKLTGRAALDAVLAHSLCFDWHDAVSKRQLLVHYLMLVSTIRVFDVRIQPSLERLSRVVDAIIDRVIAPLSSRP